LKELSGKDNRCKMSSYVEPEQPSWADITRILRSEEKALKAFEDRQNEDLNGSAESVVPKEELEALFKSSDELVHKGVPRLLICSEDEESKEAHKKKYIRWEEFDTSSGESVSMKEKSTTEKLMRKMKSNIDDKWKAVDAESGEILSKKSDNKRSNSNEDAYYDAMELEAMGLQSRDEYISSKRDLVDLDGREDTVGKDSICHFCQGETNVVTLLADQEQLLARLEATEEVNMKRAQQLSQVKTQLVQIHAEKDQIEAQVSQMKALLAKAQATNSLLKRIMESKKGSKRRQVISESFVMPAIGQYGNAE